MITPPHPPSREELGLMSCDDISRYSVSSQSVSKGPEAISYYLDQDSGQYFSLLEGDGPPGPDYDRGGRNTGVRRRDKTPTHGKTERGGDGSGPAGRHALSSSSSSSSSSIIITHLTASLCLHHAHERPKETQMATGQSHVNGSVQTHRVQLCVRPTTCVTLVREKLPIDILHLLGRLSWGHVTCRARVT